MSSLLSHLATMRHLFGLLTLAAFNTACVPPLYQTYMEKEPPIASMGTLSVKSTPVVNTGFINSERGLIATIDAVYFDIGSARLRANAKSVLDNLIPTIQQYSNRTVLIEGHADSTGGDTFNQQLSEQRAISVGNALAERGIPPARMVARGFGENRPVANNNRAAGRQKNRRVEITILNEGVVNP